MDPEKKDEKTVTDKDTPKEVIAFESFEEIEDIVTATGKGSVGCCN